MSKMLQIRNVPDALHRKLKARAAEEGLSLSDFVMAELRHLAERPGQAAFLARRAKPIRAEVIPSPAEILRAERDRR